MLYVEERDRPAILDYDPVARNSGETANEMA
jgi:hypothetical protein